MAKQRVEDARLIRPEYIEVKIKELILSQQPDIAAIIHPGATFLGDLGLDSLDAVELVMKAEEEFDIEIADEIAAELSTVQSAVDLIHKMTRGSHAQD